MEPQHSGTDGSQQLQAAGNWFFPALLAIFLLILFAVTQCAPEPPPVGATTAAEHWTPSEQPTGETVSLTIDFGNGAKKEFATLAWRADMTVADLMEEASKYQPGIEFTQSGSGEMGLLTSLDGLKNEDAGGRNWIYRVDDKFAHVSFCVEKLEAGMHVLWTFTDELYNGEPADEAAEP